MMNQLTEIFTLTFPGPTQPNFTVSKSFLFAGSEWFAGLNPSAITAEERKEVYVCFKQLGGVACSVANTEIKYKISGRHKDKTAIELNGKATWCCNRTWCTKSFNPSELFYDITVKLTMTRTVYNIATGALVDDLLAIGDSAMYADINIIASDRSHISAYKIFLMMRSSVFRRMFSNPMSESTTNTITIDDVEPAAVRSFVRFTYTDQLNSCCVSVCMDLYRMAHKYEVQGLIVQCTQHLNRLLSDENVVDILLLGECYGASDLCDCALTYISEHAATLSTRVDFARRLNLYLSDHLTAACCCAADATSSTVPTTDTEAPSSTQHTTTHFTTTSTSDTYNTSYNSTTSTIATSTSTSSSTSTYSPGQCSVALLRALAGISPGISQYAHLNFTEKSDAEPLLYKCEHCMSDPESHMV